MRSGKVKEGHSYPAEYNILLVFYINSVRIGSNFVVIVSTEGEKNKLTSQFYDTYEFTVFRNIH